jgi:hypothetical protein
VRDGIKALPGIQAVTYDPHQDIFEVRYEAGRLGLPAIWAAVHQAGRKMGREYTPEIISE